MSSMEKLVTVMVPTYNVEKFIDRCLESILSQNYSNIELIVVDDGSTDDTWSHIQAFMERDSRVKGFHRENAGVSATRNYAMSQATGDYYQFVDGDDYLRKDAIEVLVNALEESNADWVNCQYSRIDEDGKELEGIDFTQGFIDIASQEKKFSLIVNQLLEYKIGYEVWNKLFLASIINSNRIRFTEDCHIGEDLAFNISYAFHADSINCIEDRLYIYQVRSNSSMEQAKNLTTNIKEYLALVKGVEPQFSKVFTGDTREKFYQIFFKLMLRASWNFTAEETLRALRTIDDNYYYDNLSESLKHKAEFQKFLRQDMAMLYYKYGLYINAYIKGDFKEKVYLAIYNFYRRLRSRDTLREWQLS